MTFQRKIATHRFTLFVALALGVVLWLTDRRMDGQALLGMLPAALAIYLTSELNNTFALLRISSRMIGSVLALLLPMAVTLHPLQPAHAVLVFAVIVLFPLFASYQRPFITLFSFLTFLLLGCAALFVPQFLLLTPVFWVAQLLLRSFSLRGWVASLLGVLLPGWFAFTYYYLTDQTEVFVERCNQVVTLAPSSYEALTLHHWLVAGFAFLLFLVGMIDVNLNSGKDKTRVRNSYMVVTLFGGAGFIGLTIQPQMFNELLPLCLVPTAIVGGHFIALSYGRIQNWLTFLFFVAALAISIYNDFF